MSCLAAPFNAQSSCPCWLHAKPNTPPQRRPLLASIEASDVHHAAMLCVQHSVTFSAGSHGPVFPQIVSLTCHLSQGPAPHINHQNHLPIDAALLRIWTGGLVAAIHTVYVQTGTMLELVSDAKPPVTGPPSEALS